MWSTPSLPSLPGLLWPGVIAPDRVIARGQIKLFDFQTECKQMIYAKTEFLEIELFLHLTICKKND